MVIQAPYGICIIHVLNIFFFLFKRVIDFSKELMVLS